MSENSHVRDEYDAMLPMRLSWSSRSPYVRKVMIAAHELGIADHVQHVPTLATGRTSVPELEPFNPLGQIPTLVTADGIAVFDSSSILDFLDAHFGDHRLLPIDYPRRLDVLRRVAIAQGMTERCAGWVLLLLGPPERFDAEKVAFCERSVTNCLDSLEASAGDWAGLAIDAGHIGLAAVLGYMDFRLADAQWRRQRPRLTEWHAGFAARPSYLQTEFSAGDWQPLHKQRKQ